MPKKQIQIPDSMKPIQDLLGVPEEHRTAKATTRMQQIGPYLFDNKKELGAYCESILDSLEHGEAVRGVDTHFLLWLFKIGTKHPESTEKWTTNRLNQKLEGHSIESIRYYNYLPNHPGRNGNHLQITRDDGKKFLLPWRESCQNGSTGKADPKKAQASKDRQFVLSALRSAVDNQTFGFRKRELKAGRDRCAVSGELLTSESGIDVDHHPVPFKDIVGRMAGSKRVHPGASIHHRPAGRYATDRRPANPSGLEAIPPGEGNATTTDQSRTQTRDNQTKTS